jgi:hypothetical protein
MGSSSERMIEKQQEDFDRSLAGKLGITYDELMELDYEIDTEESEEGMVYNYILTFRTDASREILDKINGIDENHSVMIPAWELDHDDYYEEQYDAIATNKECLTKFSRELDDLERLNNVKLEYNNQEKILKRLIFIGVIGVLEAFLSDTFINLVMKNDAFVKRFVETAPDFKNKKIELSQIFETKSRIKEIVKKVILDIVYHNLSKVRMMYEKTFIISFPDISKLSKHISIRHDLVHRNGKNKDDQDVVLDTLKIIDLLRDVKAFMVEIDYRLRISFSDNWQNLIDSTDAFTSDFMDERS